MSIATVREIMNPEVFTVTADASPRDVRDAILGLAISAAPVIDESRRPVGVVWLRDLVRAEDGALPISTPPLCVPMHATVDDAARMLAECGRHHLVVVGSDGRVVGFISSLDLVRGLIGFPRQAPAPFPHFDAALGITWSDTVLFDDAHVERAPVAPGVLVVSVGGRDRNAEDVHVEAVPSIRGRARELLRGPPKSLVGRGVEALRFRWSEIEDDATRSRTARTVHAWIARLPESRAPLA
jgi:CBS domain-containing protein